MRLASHISRAEGSNTSVLAVSLPTHAPMVTKRVIGRGAGAIYTCAVPFFEGAGSELSAVALRLLDNVIVPLQPVSTCFTSHSYLPTSAVFA